MKTLRSKNHSCDYASLTGHATVQCIFAFRLCLISTDFILQHDLGKKWSLYLTGLIQQMFDDLKIKSKIESTDNTLIFTTYHNSEVEYHLRY